MLLDQEGYAPLGEPLLTLIMLVRLHHTTIKDRVSYISKKQHFIEDSSLGADFMAFNICYEYIRGLKYT